VASRPEEFDVLPAWRFWFGFRVFGVGDDLPEPLRVEAALSDDVSGTRGLPVLARTGARFLAMITDEGLGWWTQSDDSFELVAGNTIDLILEEIQLLEKGVTRLSLRSAAVPALLDHAREVGWASPAADPVLEALKTKSSDELAPHVVAIVDAWLGLPTHSMPCLDLVAKSGAAGFATVAGSHLRAHGRGQRRMGHPTLGEGGGINRLAPLRFTAPPGHWRRRRASHGGGGPCACRAWRALDQSSRGGAGPIEPLKRSAN
jgi:hypothetical protein